MSDEAEALGELLRWRRRQTGQSLRQAAQEVGCSFSTLDRSEHGRDITFDNFVLFAKWLGIPILD
jgi:transcriptional regulator with XRE-family HTH domain